MQKKAHTDEANKRVLMIQHKWCNANESNDKKPFLLNLYHNRDVSTFCKIRLGVYIIIILKGKS